MEYSEALEIQAKHPSRHRLNTCDISQTKYFGICVVELNSSMGGIASSKKPNPKCKSFELKA